MTKSAVKKFQLANKLTDDGIAGAKTLDAMKNAGDKGIIRKAIDKLTPDKDMEPIRPNIDDSTVLFTPSVNFAEICSILEQKFVQDL